MPKKAQESEEPGFEKSLEELEELVEKMEDGELSLEQSLQTYERGIKLARACQKALDEAEQRVEILSEQDESTEAFDAAAED